MIKKKRQLAGGKCLCVSGKVVLWLTYFYVRILVPMSYLKLWNYIYIYIVRPSVPSCPSRRRRRRPLSVRPVRPVVVVRPLSVRPVVRPVVVRPSSVRPSVPSSSSVLCPSVPSSVPSSSSVLCPSELELELKRFCDQNFSGDPSKSTTKHKMFLIRARRYNKYRTYRTSLQQCSKLFRFLFQITFKPDVEVCKSKRTGNHQRTYGPTVGALNAESPKRTFSKIQKSKLVTK